MIRINLLSEEVANKIAAGEVIERPVSVVKELVENAIDAKANSIDIIIKNGGKSYIKVADNGLGMSKDDAILSFERHSTSKINKVEDIFHISTLGFRGEALPSIASVSDLTLISKEKEEQIGTKIRIRAGKFKNVEETSANTGTAIIVENLFYNVPARRKFLKSVQVEYRHILNYIHYQSILFPQIHFRLLHNDDEKINYPVCKNYKERLELIFGKERIDNFLFLEKKSENISLKAYISNLNLEEESLPLKYIFLNGRYIKDKIIIHSINAAYENFIKRFKRKNFSYILILEISPSLVDFNVHPAKLEIRLQDPSLVHTYIKKALIDKLLESEEKKFQELKQNFPQKANPYLKKNNFKNHKKISEKLYQPSLFETEKEINEKLSSLKKEEPDFNLSYLKEEDLINPWQFGQMYIFAQDEEGLLIIDQHAAHERILYEKFLHRVFGSPSNSQKLLLPLVINLTQYLSNSLSTLIEENLEVFSKMGFSVKLFSGNSIVIDSVPCELHNITSEKIFLEILQYLNEEFTQTEDFKDSLVKSIACKSAIKAGQILNKKEMMTLISDLFACQVPYFCPHGRPTIIKMNLKDFDKKFKRLE